VRTENQRQGHGEYAAWARDILDLQLPVSEEWFELLGSAKFSKNRLVKDSVARVTQDEVRAIAGRLHGRLLIDYYAAERSLIVDALRAIDEQFRLRKRALSGVDFDDLEEFAIRLLESNTDLRRKLQDSFDHILMDELQDTNPLQWKLINLIRRPDAFFAVGDINQSIFGFRHAEPGLFQEYRRSLEQKGKAIDELRENWRSRAEVLDAVNRIFAGPAPGIEKHSLHTGAGYRTAKAPCVETIVAFGETTEETARIEALWVAARIRELVGALELETGKARFRDIAILTRANLATGALQTALDEFGIPSLVVGGLTFYETREVRDLMLLLAVLANPRNEIALAGVLRSPIFGLTDEDLLRLTANGISLADAVEQQPPANWTLIEELRLLRNRISPDRLLRRVMDDCDYESGLSSRGRANVEKFLSALRTRYSVAPAPLSQILELMENAAPDAEAPPADFGDSVRLMTIHKSKGLEFPVVFLPFLHSSRGSGFPIISYTHEHGLGVKWRDPAVRDGTGDAVWEANRLATEAWQSEEDDRLLYVGMTRAKERLVLSFSATRFSRSAWWQLISSKLYIDAQTRVDKVVERNEAGLRIVYATQPPELLRAGHAEAAGAGQVFLESPEVEGQYDSTASATSISVFAQCPRKYYLSRYIRWKEAPGRMLPSADDEEFPAPEPGELEATEIGTQVHALLANQCVRNPSAEAMKLAERFRASALGKQAARASHKQHEWDFVMAVEDVVLRGQIDLWFEHNRDLVVVDYKTDNVKKPVDADRAAVYELQLRIYAIALEAATGKVPDRGYLHFLRTDEIVEVDLHPLQLGAARQVIRDFRDAQAALDFPLHTGDHCYRCEYYRKACPAGRVRRAAADD
jgi:ATP-dependent exoDNAse (exonuclease V) beta subunit